jgi:hemerythrin superfamily protein
MNVITLLKDDHEKVSKLFKSYEAAKEAESDNDKEQIFGQICEELSAHAEAEEELFYPAVDAHGQGDEKAQDTVKEAHEEHKLVKTLLAELEEMSASDEQYDAKVKVLKDLVEHHVEEEEGQMMPKAKKLLSSDELEQLGAQVESRKEELKAEYAKEKGQEGRSASGRTKSSSAEGSGGSSSKGASSSQSAARGSSSRSVKASRSPRPARRPTIPASGAKTPRKK